MRVGEQALATPIRPSSISSPGAVNSEVTLKLGGGEIVTAIITNESTQSLGLKAGDHACAAIKASSVILGVE